MKSELRVHTTSIKLYLSIGLFVTILIIFLSVWFRFEVGIILLSVAGVIASVGGAIVWERVSLVRHNRQMMAQDVRIKRAQADEAEFRRFIIIVGRNERVVMSANADIIIEPVVLAGNAPLLIEAGQPVEAPLDFYQVMTDDQTVFAIIGPQRVGKSSVAMHISDYLSRWGMGQNRVIGVKSEPNEWVNCERFIGVDVVSKALLDIIEELNRRHTENIKTPRLNVFLDDWINIVVSTPIANEFFIRASTDMLSAGIVPYFMLQSDTSADWGNRYGAMLKNNFTKLLIKAPRRNGILIAAEATGAIQWPGEREWKPIELPRGLPQLATVASEIERIRAAIVANRGASYGHIARLANVEGSRPTQNEAIKRVVREFGLEGYEIGNEAPVKKA